MDAIKPLDIWFNAEHIKRAAWDLIFMDPTFDMDKYQWHNQVSLRESTDWFAGTGSLYDYTKKEFIDSTSNYTQTAKKLEGSYLERVIKDVEAYAKRHYVNIGRVRIMRLQPKTCYTLHTDLEEFRYHIPIETNDSNFFVVNNVIYRMPLVGQMYRFRTQAPHTAVNASTEPRTHLVFDTFT